MDYFLRRFFGFTPQQLPSLHDYLSNFPTYMPVFPPKNLQMAFFGLANVQELDDKMLQEISFDKIEIPSVYFILGQPLGLNISKFINLFNYLTS